MKGPSRCSEANRTTALSVSRVFPPGRHGKTASAGAPLARRYADMQATSSRGPSIPPLTRIRDATPRRWRSRAWSRRAANSLDGPSAVAWAPKTKRAGRESGSGTRLSRLGRQRMARRSARRIRQAIPASITKGMARVISAKTKTSTVETSSPRNTADSLRLGPASTPRPPRRFVCRAPPIPRPPELYACKGPSHSR